MRINQAILPVAGLGTRFLPWTKVVPKELLPIGNRPIIAHLVDECLDAGINDICFVISKGKESIPQYFAHDEELAKELERRDKLHYLEDLKRYDNTRFTTVYQDQQHGDGHAILQAAGWVEHAPLAVLFGDDLFHGTDSGLAQLLRAAEQVGEGAVVALENIPQELTHKYGIVEVDHEHAENPRIKKLKSMVEKPKSEEAPSTLGIVGRYILPRSVYDALSSVGAEEGKEIRIIDALIRELERTPIYGMECEGTRLDTGTPEGYAEAVRQWNS